MHRRAFVQSCLGAAGAGVLGAATGSFVRPLLIGRPPAAPPVRYFGAHRTMGPAPRGVPLIPVRLNEDGAFEGVPVVDVGVDDDGESATLDVLEWYKYCDHQNAPGLRADNEDADNTLVYHIPDDAVATVTPWFAGRTDAAVRPEHFPDVEFGASVSWRSRGLGGQDVLSGVIVRLPRDAVRHARRDVRPPAEALTDAEFTLLKERFFVEHGDSTFVAASTFCTHFCCVPGYKLTESARERNAWDQLYCACHHSAYDLATPVAYVYHPQRARDAGA